MSKFRNKYRVESARLEGYDYSSEGMYFITINTERHQRYFGKIVEGKMLPTEIGKIAHEEWFRTLEIRNDMNLQLHEFVVMPNHIHGIIEIGKNKFNVTNPRRDATHGVSHSHKDQKLVYKNTFSPQSKNIASIIRGYKSAVTKHAHILGKEFSWQTRYYDRIIRDYKEYTRIANYIKSNVDNWAKDNHY
jgi:REP element-mobilizing transposase RayT